MLKLTSVTLKNFLSVGNVAQTIALNGHGLTLVLGSNMDANGGQTRNGAGKTAILQAISYGLFGKPLTKIKLPNLVNNVNNKGMLVILEFEDGTKKYRIERGQKPAVLRYYVNDREMKDEEDGDNRAQGENKHTQAEIERVVGMSHTMFRHIVALNTFTEPFLKMSVGDQRMIIEELLGVAQISQRAEALKKAISQTKEVIRDQETTIRATTEANSRIEATIRQAEANLAHWERQHEAALVNLQAEIEAVETIDFDAELAAFDALDAFTLGQRDLKAALANEQRDVARLRKEGDGLAAEAAQYRRDAGRVDAQAQIARLQNEIQRKERDAVRHETQAAAYLREIEGVERDLARTDQTCRCCGQALMGTDHLATVMANLTARRADLEAKAVQEASDAQERRTEIETIHSDIETTSVAAAAQVADLTTKSSERDAMAQAVFATLAEHEKRVEIITSELAALGNAPVTVFGSRDEVYKAKQLRDTLVRDLEMEAAKANPFLSQVESLAGTLQEIDRGPLDEATGLLKHQDFLMKLLTSKDSFIRKRIIEQNLNYLNSRMNLYLDKLGLPHEVRFVSDLSVEITLLGRDFDFEQLSRGEMNRVIMATSWSFRDVWESLNSSVNLLWIDELIDNGIDDSGAEAALDVLKTMARDRGKNVFLISHKDNLTSRVGQILMVHKENDFTRFEMAA